MANPLSGPTTSFVATCDRWGLDPVADGIYQVRDLDVSTMTLVEGARGVVVIDPPAQVEPAAGAIEFYRERRGDRPVTAVIYTHSHTDRLGGLPGVGGVGGVGDADVPIVAPAGFLEHTAAALLPPIIDITRTGQEETIDGVRMIFQLTPGDETPPGMSFFLPCRGALCLAEKAMMRDARSWSSYLTETLAMFGILADVVFAPHHRPVRGRSNIVWYVSRQRDVYAYLHDQTLRMLAKGHTGDEIAEMIELPPALREAGDGSVPDNVNAIYQRHLGRFDGNPADLWQHPPPETARRYVESFGGLGNVVAKARGFAEAGDLRFAAQLLRHAVFADPEGEVAKELLAQVYERLARGSDDTAWREFYLTGTRELRHAAPVTPVELGISMASALPVERLFDTLALRVDAKAAWHESITIDWHLDDRPYRTTLRHGVLIHHPGTGTDPADLTLRLSKADLVRLLAGQGLEAVFHEGDPDALQRLMSHLDAT